MKYTEINWKEWEECSVKEYSNLKNGEGIHLVIPGYNSIFLKKKQKYPILIQGSIITQFELFGSGSLNIHSKSPGGENVTINISCEESLETLEEVIKKSKNLRK